MSILEELAEIPTIFSHPHRVRSKFLTADGYRTHYVEAGDSNAPPLVLVHGHSLDIGCGLERWYPTILPLADKFRVFAVDQLGHGETDAPRDAFDLGHIRVRAKHLIEFISALDVGPVHLVGQSQGGWIIAYIALVRPDLVRRMVLVDSATIAAADQSGLPYFDKIFIPGTMMPRVDMSKAEGVRAYMGLFLENKEAMIDELIDKMLKQSEKWREPYRINNERKWSEENRWHYAEQYTLDGIQIRDLVHKILVPTLFVWGKNSEKPLAPGLEAYKRVRGAEFHVFDNANHFLWMDQPKKFNNLTIHYLSQ